ncbi:hypothetical protein J7382_18715 [Shimia sp. R11_0]|uniref:hypothetical protein n=1 Tax=Shimia sp. R11_0 TaxID=2821096 RepID=UPI001ADADCDF|nr:hypothetical protein [Shimia sp. R11_0]MBO9479583.1 hypothetical protein [Shimia sp. R11_0]
MLFTFLALILMGAACHASEMDLKGQLEEIFYEMTYQGVSVTGCQIVVSREFSSSDMSYQPRTVVKYVDLSTLDFARMDLTVEKMPGSDLFGFHIPSIDGWPEPADLNEMSNLLKKNFPESDWPFDIVARPDTSTMSEQSNFLLREYPRFRNLNRVEVTTKFGIGIRPEATVLFSHPSMLLLRRLHDLIEVYAASADCVN